MLLTQAIEQETAIEAVDWNTLGLLIIEILVSNIGGTATLIGDPPNIMIAGATGLTFVEFIVTGRGVRNAGSYSSGGRSSRPISSSGGTPASPGSLGVSV